MSLRVIPIISDVYDAQTAQSTVDDRSVVSAATHNHIIAAMIALVAVASCQSVLASGFGMSAGTGQQLSRGRGILWILDLGLLIILIVLVPCRPNADDGSSDELSCNLFERGDDKLSGRPFRMVSLIDSSLERRCKMDQRRAQSNLSRANST